MINLKAARVNSGYTQKQVANKIGVSRNTIVNWENGRSIPGVDKVNILLKLYHMNYDNIIFYAKK